MSVIIQIKTCYPVYFKNDGDQTKQLCLVSKGTT